MRQVFAVLIIVGLAGLFTWSAYVIRRDFRQRFARIQQQLEDDANALLRHLFNRRDT